LGPAHFFFPLQGGPCTKGSLPPLAGAHPCSYAAWSSSHRRSCRLRRWRLCARRARAPSLFSHSRSIPLLLKCMHPSISHPPTLASCRPLVLKPAVVTPTKPSITANQPTRLDPSSDRLSSSWTPASHSPYVHGVAESITACRSPSELPQ
jgi:hypothetical protein